MINLLKVKEALAEIESSGGDNPSEYIESAIDNLKNAAEAMNTVSVCGRSNVDKLLGCMMAIDLIIGEEKDGRQNNK